MTADLQEHIDQLPQDEPGARLIAEAIDRLAEQQLARNMLALATAEKRGLDGPRLDHARRLMGLGPTSL